MVMAITFAIFGFTGPFAASLVRCCGHWITSLIGNQKVILCLLKSELFISKLLCLKKTRSKKPLINLFYKTLNITVILISISYLKNICKINQFGCSCMNAAETLQIVTKCTFYAFLYQNYHQLMLNSKLSKRKSSYPCLSDFILHHSYQKIYLTGQVGGLGSHSSERLNLSLLNPV